MRDVSGKVAVITGGAAGIGLGIVEACVEAGMELGSSTFAKTFWIRSLNDCGPAVPTWSAFKPT